ncbi:MAG: lipopolysaccharide biosynthesis protein [Prevotellaceae bacterium]|nr:lipopolysaccharide biosynthesis protein [Prevotellaceae bacterium]
MPTTNLKDKAAQGFLWGALNNGTMQVLNAVFGIVLARLLSQEDYGLIGMLTIFTLIANSLQDSGFVAALTNRRNATHRDYNSVFWFNICVSLCLYIFLFFFAPLIADFFNEPILTDLSRYYFFGFFIASFSIVPRAILFRQIRQRELAIMGLVALLVSGIVGITMAYNGMAYWGLATQTITFNLMVSILSWVFSCWRPTMLVSITPIREMFGFSSKMLITNIFNQVNNNIFSLVLGKLYTKVEVGTYSQANKWNLMGASTITGMVQGVAQPTFVQVGDDPARLRRAFSKMLRFTCFISFPVMFGLSLIAPEFIVLLIKDKWLSSVHFMQYLCIGGAFLPIATLYFNLIISRGKSNIYMWNIIAQGCTILSCILLVHVFGGSILHMIQTYVTIIILWTGIWHIFLYKEIRYSFLSAIRDILPFLFIASISMLITYFATRWIDNLYLLLVTRIFLASFLYLATLWLFGTKILYECISYLLHKKQTKG